MLYASSLYCFLHIWAPNIGRLSYIENSKIEIMETDRSNNGNCNSSNSSNSSNKKHPRNIQKTSCGRASPIWAGAALDICDAGVEVIEHIIITLAEQA